MTEIYLLFFLEKRDPLIGSVSSSLKRFLRLLACKFISPQTVKGTLNFKELFDVKKHKYGNK